MAYAKIKNTEGGVTIGTQLAGVVVIGPIKIDGGVADIALQTVTGGAGTTTPTAYKLQVSLDPAGGTGSFGDVASATITASASANAVVNMAPATNVIGYWVRVVSGAAFAAGTATLWLFGIEK